MESYMKKVVSIIVVLALAILLGARIDEFRESGVSLATASVTAGARI